MENLHLFTTQIDSLTGLPNRTYLLNTLRQKLAAAHQNGQLVALLFIEFDDLARFNETFGYDIDDKLIIQLGEKIGALLGTNDMLARVGNEQLAIISDNLQSEESAEAFANQILSTLYEPFFVSPNMFYISASIGISLSSADENDGYRLLKTAENTMRKVQKDGKNHIAFTRHTDQSSLKKSIQLMEDLPAALENGQIHFVYQAQYSHDKENFCGAEILARWQHPTYGDIPTEMFISIAEQSGMIGPLTIKALIEASKMFSYLEKAGIHDFSLSVNISGVVLMERDFIQTLQFLLFNYNLKGRKLNFEIMEETLIKNIDKVANLLKRIKAMGIAIHLDDYGTGYTSLKYLAALPISSIKIDKSYIQNIEREIKSQALFQAIVDMAHALDIDVIVEGVETAMEDDFVKKFGWITVQGYYFSKPLQFDDFLQRLKKER